MKYIQKKQEYISKNDFSDFVFQENCLFFDIETTGFSPKTSSLYLIGCLRKEGTNIIIDQFFAESKETEKDVLEKFIELLHHYKTIISFNGLGFDLPFIKAKCAAHGIFPATDDLECFFGKFQYIDIFKETSSIKHLLQLQNYKQKTLEQFLDIKRNDKYSGGELISVYEEYTKTQDPDAEKLLLLHNFEDVLGMLDLLPILSYCKTLSGEYEINDVEINTYTNYNSETCLEMMITLHNNYPVPKRISHQSNDIYIIMNKDITKIRIPVYEGELKFFYPNYKDYFYLPVEDMAIHKSIASYVDKKYREKAKAGNCYTRKQGKFLPQYNTIMNPIFKKDYKDKCGYFELTEDFKTSDVMLRKYIEHLFTLCSSKK